MTFGLRLLLRVFSLLGKFHEHHCRAAEGNANRSRHCAAQHSTQLSSRCTETISVVEKHAVLLKSLVNVAGSPDKSKGEEG